MKQTNKRMLAAIIIVICGFIIIAITYWGNRARIQAPSTEGSSQFVTLTDVVPDAILEIRYFSTYNFVGARIDGYLEPTALLTKAAADSLKAVSDDVVSQGYRLNIYDAYRPQYGVDHFVRWAADIPDTLMRAYFYPDLDKSVLFDQEYIMAKSGHTRGSTVDLTLFDMATEKELDMGGTFDWFGPESHPDFCGNPETGEFTVAGDGQSVMNRAALRCHEIVVVCSYQAAAGGILGCADIVNITTGCALSAYHLLVHLVPRALVVVIGLRPRPLYHQAQKGNHCQ